MLDLIRRTMGNPRYLTISQEEIVINVYIEKSTVVYDSNPNNQPPQ